MTTHLSSQEIVSAIDNALTAARHSHLDGCASCQAQVEDLRAVMADAREGADVPEPSPLFWDHFQARVLTAVQSEGQHGVRAWWTNWVDARTLVTLGATVVAIVAIVASVALYMNRPVAPAPSVLPES